MELNRPLIAAELRSLSAAVTTCSSECRNSAPEFAKVSSLVSLTVLILFMRVHACPRPHRGKQRPLTRIRPRVGSFADPRLNWTVSPSSACLGSPYPSFVERRRSWTVSGISFSDLLWGICRPCVWPFFEFRFEEEGKNPKRYGALAMTSARKLRRIGSSIPAGRWLSNHCRSPRW